MARGDAESEEHAARLYIAESLRLAPQGKVLSMSLGEFLEQRKPDTRKPSEILSDLETRGALKVVRKNEPS